MIHPTATVSEATNRNMPARRNTLAQLLALHANPESQNAQRHRQTNRCTDDRITPITDRTKTVDIRYSYRVLKLDWFASLHLLRATSSLLSLLLVCRWVHRQQVDQLVVMKVHLDVSAWVLPSTHNNVLFFFEWMCWFLYRYRRSYWYWK